MIFFTADTHFGHSNIINYCDRPFTCKEEHDAALIERWNSVVKPGDIVYHLGDFGFGSSQYLKSICNRLRGQINLIRGNHDKNISQIQSRFGFVKDVHLLETKLMDKKLKIFMSHYPHRSWIHKPRDAYHLFGHVHGNMGPFGLSFDVGVDCWNYTPLSIEQVHTHIEQNLMPAWVEEKQKHKNVDVIEK